MIWSFLYCEATWKPRAESETSVLTWKPPTHLLQLFPLAVSSGLSRTDQSKHKIFHQLVLNWSIQFTFGQVGTSSRALSVLLNLSWIPTLKLNQLNSPLSITIEDLPVLICLYFRHVKVCLWLVGEDVKCNLCSFFLDVLNKESNLHGSSYLLPYCGDPRCVPHEGVHGHPILDDKRRDGDEWQHQHVEDEELLATWCCWVDLVAANSPDGVFHPLQLIKAWCYNLVFSC